MPPPCRGSLRGRIATGRTVYADQERAASERDSEQGALSCSGREPVLSDFTSHFLERVLTFWR
jgi:hypothetical protein